MVWKPNVTVAAIIERDGKFLLVEEETSDGLRLNQPAGHLEAGESLIAASIRETLEETAWEFFPQALTGIYRWTRPQGDVTYLRFAFTGKLGEHQSDRVLDEGIVRAVWLSRDEIATCIERHRSPLVLRCVDDYLSGNRYSLGLLISFGE